MTLKTATHCLWCAAAASLLATACSHGRTGSEADNIRTVMLYTAGDDAQAHTQTYAGTVQEDKNVKASFMADGRIASMNVKVGDRVKRGQLLAVIDDTDYRIGVNQLTAQYNQMTEEKKRMDRMFELHNVAPNDYEKFVAGYEQLALQLKGAQNRLDYTRLVSPSAGYVAEQYVQPGELVGAGTPIYKIADDTRLVALVDLPASAYARRGLITGVEGRATAVDEPFAMTIESFTPDVDNNLLYQLKLSVPAAVARVLTPGMNIDVSVNYAREADATVRIPSRAVAANGDSTFVWVFNPADSTLSRRDITVAGQSGHSMVAVDRLAPGTQIVETGVKQLYEGEKVRPARKSDYTL